MPGGTLYNGLYGKDPAPPERGTFLCIKTFKGRADNLSFQPACYGCEKVEKTFYFFIYSYLKDSDGIYSTVKRNGKVLNCERSHVTFVNRRYTKGVLYLPKMSYTVKWLVGGWSSELSGIKLCYCTAPVNGLCVGGGLKAPELHPLPRSLSEIALGASQLSLLTGRKLMTP